MKRSAPLRRTTPIRRRPARRPSAYRTRERDFEFMGWVRRQPCIVRAIPPDPNRLTPCGGFVEADHLGARPLGRKADDRTCAPLCRQHHRERSDHSGAFRNLVQAELRAWRALALDLVAREWDALLPLTALGIVPC